MDLHAGDCLVRGYERRMEAIHLPDSGDRHVLAAAVECEAEALVTWNVSDFPAAALEPYGIVLWTPEDLLMALESDDPDLLLRVMREHRASHKNPPTSARDYLEMLRNQKLTRVADRMEGRLNDL